MFIAYRRTGGIFALIAIAAVALVATVLTVAGAAVVLIGALVVGAAVILVRAVLPTWGRRRTVPSPTYWPGETIDASVVESTVLAPAEPDRARDRTMKRSGAAPTNENG